MDSWVAAERTGHASNRPAASGSPVDRGRAPRAIGRRAAKATRVGLAYLALIGVVLSMTFPLIWMVFTSLKSEQEVHRYPPTLWPEQITLHAYFQLFDLTAFGLWFRNSVVVSIVVTVIAVTISAMAAYVLARFHFRFFAVFSRFVLFAYMVPAVLMLIPIFQLVYQLRLGNNLLSLVLVYNTILIPFGLWTLRAYFAGIPHEIEEAALVDGASRFRAFRSVVLPQAAPGLIATALFAFHVAWNEYLFASVLLWSSRTMTVSAGISTLVDESVLVPWPVLMAAGVLVTAPVILLFGLLQRYLVAGWGGGAVKG